MTDRPRTLEEVAITIRRAYSREPFHMTPREIEESIAALRAHLKQDEARDEAAKLICELLELGDDRLLASDGPAGGQLPDLSPKEWGRIYRACLVIARKP